jgi:uridine kinase
VISRVIIHVDGSPGAGKTTFVERLLGAVDE